MPVYYETLILANPEITSEETTALENHFQKIVSQQGGTVKSFDRWGKYRLSYPIEKHDYGVYFLGRFETSKEKAFSTIDELNTLCAVKLESYVMRHMHSHLEAYQFEGYVRPESLEEAPHDQQVENLLRDNNNNFSRGENDRSHRGHGEKALQENEIDFEGNDDESEE